MRIQELHLKQKNKHVPEKMEELIRKARKEDEKLVKGMFEFTDAQGGWIDFAYRMYDRTIMMIRLNHGEICELPIGIIKHLRNTRKKVRKITGDLSANARGVPTTIEYTSRINFTPVNL